MSAVETVPGSDTLGRTRSAARDRQDDPARGIECARCDSRWSGVSRCHCAGCHRTFNGLAQFDAHRSQRGEFGACLDPEHVRGRDGERVLWLHDGLWCGTEEPPAKSIPPKARKAVA